MRRESPQPRADMGPGAVPPDVRRVLIFLLGSLGDTLLALPALRLIARRFPDAQRRVLTSFPVSEKAAPMSSLLEGTGLIHDYFRYPPRVRDLQDMLGLMISIRRWSPDLLIYLHEPRGRAIALRDAAYFRACGIRSMIGMPYAEKFLKPRFLEHAGRYEHRAEYLARMLAPLGDSELADRAVWSLQLSEFERSAAWAAVAPLRDCAGLLAVSIGTKADVNDWGNPNWVQLLQSLGRRLQGWGLIVVGAASERDRSAELLAAWNGSGLNLCGNLSARESGAALELADVFIGHDSGPMHLAAAAGTPCIGIFSGRNPPGLWFPYGENHRPIYRPVECSGCGLTECRAFNKKCITSISVTEVAAAALATLDARAGEPQKPRVLQAR